MRVLYVEGAAIHDGPESCVGVPRGRSEALIGGVWAGLLSRETTMQTGVPTLCFQAEGHAVGDAICESPMDPARSENPGTHASSMRENREIPRAPAVVDRCPVLRVRGVVDRRRWAVRGTLWR